MGISARCLPLLLLSMRAFASGLPQVDFDRMGTVGIAGTFNGLDFLQTSSPTFSFDPSASTLLSRTPEGALSPIASTNPGGRIVTSCTLKDTVYFGGLFSSIGEQKASNVLSYVPKTETFSALAPGGPNGEVEVLHCDLTENKVWVGGNFTSPGVSVAVWDPKSNSWSKAPFNGLAGSQPRVQSITANASDTSLFFAGSFITNFEGPGGSISNGTNNPNVPFSAGATPFSSSLVPIPLAKAEIDGSASSTNPQFSNIKTILCPSGADGLGNTWFAADGNQALITIRTFSFISANGVRLGNTFLPNHGTTGFSVTTIPDNKVQTMHFRDPSSGQMQACTDPCPLSTDSSLLYQDFLFDNTLDITGVQIKLSQFTGDAPGLHILQLLSSGAFASAIDENNGESCFASNPSNITRTGDWAVKVVNTNIPGTIQSVLVSEVTVGVSAAVAPTLTWIPYVSAVGNYDINLLIPGCIALQDCAKRTTVKITVFPGEGLDPQVSTISQQTDEDSSVTVYSGPISPSSPSFVTTVSLTLADNPVGSGQGGVYEVVGDRVQLILKSAGNGSGDGLSGSVETQGTRSSFGFFEWVRSGISSVDATQTLPNTTVTSLDKIGFDLFDGAGGNNGLAFAKPFAVITVAHHTSGIIFLGGIFTLSSGPASGSANLVAFKAGALVRLQANGLNGPVNAFFLINDSLFVGGAFTDNLTGGSNGQLRGIALYDVQEGAWRPLGGGLDGSVTSLNMQNNQLQVTGNFTRTFASAQDEVGAPSNGFATWDLSSNRWVSSGGFILGQMALITNGTSATSFLAGNVNTSRKFGASGMVLLKNGNADVPQVSPFGIPLYAGPPSSSPSTVTWQRRGHPRRALGWLSQVKSALLPRQTTSQLPLLPSPPLQTAPSVFTGAFWKNSTSSAELVIVGGNFTFFSPGLVSSLTAIALYNPTTNTVTGLKGTQINGTVHALFVNDNQLYIGGKFTLGNQIANGFAIYDLSAQAWVTDAFQPLSSVTGSEVLVRSISKPASNQNMVVVAGSFSRAGSLSCESICGYDLQSKQWTALGNGIRGEVTVVNYAGNNEDVLIASGSFSLSNNVVCSVAQYSLLNSTWSPVGIPSDLPGPVTALEVNDRNQSSIFAAGSAIDSTPFLSFWNGIAWSGLDSVLHVNTSVTQLTMVPLQDSHPGNDIVQPDRMLLISGYLPDPSFGTASSALFDGANIIPYIQTSDFSGGSGVIAALFRSLTHFSFEQRHFLATGVVILISIAIAAGVVFAIALAGILWSLFSRRDDKLNKFHTAEDDDDDSMQHRPSSLLEHINAATRTTILGTNAFGNTMGKGDHIGDKRDAFGPDASNYLRAETPMDAAGGLAAEELSRPAHARYSFDGAGEGELPIVAGTELEVLDDRDPAWWYARDVRTGQEGVVPAAYLY